MLSDTYHTQTLRRAQNATERKHQRYFRQTLRAINDTLTSKGRDYNNLVTMPEHLVHGDKSWSTLLWIKVHRIASVIEAGKTEHESLDDSILDLATYAVAYYAWRRMLHDEASVDTAAESVPTERVTGTTISDGDSSGGGASSAPVLIPDELRNHGQRAVGNQKRNVHGQYAADSKEDISTSSGVNSTG